MQNFRALGALPPDPRTSGGWGFAPNPIGFGRLEAPPPDPQNRPPPLRISGYAPDWTFVYTCLFCAVTSFLCTTVFVLAVAVFLPGLCISKFVLFSDTDDGPLRPKSILAI